MKNLGYDITSVDLKSGELRLIEVKGLSAPEGNIILTPNEYRVANDRRDCYWLYMVTKCRTDPKLMTIKDVAQCEMNMVSKIEYYILNLTQI